jgi:hypothetical protein
MQPASDMKRSKVASAIAIHRGKQGALVGAFGLLWVACSGTLPDSQARGIWGADSAGIDFTLTGAVGQHLCDFSATREQLTGAQLDGLSALRLHDGTGGAACDTPSYRIMVRAQDGSSTSYRATLPICISSSPILLFEDFDAWAKSTPCSWQP